MAQMIELSADRDFKIVLVVMLKDILENVGTIHEQMGNFNREIETINSSVGSSRYKKHDIRYKELFLWSYQQIRYKKKALVILNIGQ